MLEGKPLLHPFYGLVLPSFFLVFEYYPTKTSLYLNDLLCTYTLEVQHHHVLFCNVTRFLYILHAAPLSEYCILTGIGAETRPYQNTLGGSHSEHCLLMDNFLLGSFNVSANGTHQELSN